MSEIAALSDTEVQARLESHNEWALQGSKLYRRLVFEDFVHAFGFMTQIAIVAEKIDHHPEWANVYRTVDIYLTTHEAGGVSERDFELLEKIEHLIGDR
ncbi:4a-hydroxytetrahydrobiopterin dehydratase [Oceanicoccus sagamiensis]|uniref:Putative pterin-4-alpha-carbinolamine dehydratase n=1 Tax=Oceanicoccus sagamiensis TaxID=716816 RepID=A0A1X9NJ57_9GAMM|nr:4a-hydroxytetrahydrobiopterin dehydratase [Oceanicoccus sagamiensis]ARN75519.1 4a-hydroxytetrahydrobiopterin dehydratase [Oceanicoccus sagamiensis]